jgi:CheY-like chemotaxis protein
VVVPKNKRILIIDDNPAIHEDFRKLLAPRLRPTDSLDADESALFGHKPAPSPREQGYELESALQGRHGLDMVIRATQLKRPYAVVFADMRMPPGWDGVETIQHILAVTPKVELCICSAYSDYSWHDVIRRLGRPGLRLLRKPFETSEVISVASELTERWRRSNEAPVGPKASVR